MKYITYQTSDGRSHVGLLNSHGAVVEIEKQLPSLAGKTLTDIIQTGPSLWAQIAALDDAETLPLESVTLIAPIRTPIHDIICIGVNYADHLAETRQHLKGNAGISTAKTVYFSKRAEYIIGPDETVKARFDLDPCLDYEVELAVIIGKDGKNIPIDRTQEYIFGYSVFNDLSSRTLQTAHGQWFLGKSVESYTAMGPLVITPDELAHPLRLDVRSIVGGEIRQHSNTANLIHTVPEIISEISRAFTLHPGDIIATGTPSGVGMGFTPPRWLKHGDTVVCEIENIGALSNRVVSVTE